MTHDPADILSVLDDCAAAFTFPMLDNGYVYLAVTRLSLFRSPSDWAMVIEVFGHSPRGCDPTTTIQTFASKLHNRDKPDGYKSPEAHARYLANHPYDEFRSAYPIAQGPWIDAEDWAFVAADAREILLRGQTFRLPAVTEYSRHGIALQDAPRIHVFEVCRYVATMAHDDVLATPSEQRVSVPPEMTRLLQLDEWHHPDLVKDERPSATDCFRQLARVLATGDVTAYRPTEPANTHWRFWPEGGSL